MMTMQKSSTKNVDRSNLSDSEIIDSMSKDIAGWMKSNIWPYSCYSVAKNYSPFPGFEDVSAEEIRFKAYVARSNNTMNEYEQMLTELKTKYDAMKYKLINISPLDRPELEKVLKSIKIYTNETVATSKPSLFGESSNNTIFGNNTTPATTAATSSMFGNSASNNTSQSIFGNNSANQSIFGNNSTNNASIFGNNNSTTAPQSIFGDNSSVTASQNMFGKSSGSTSIFGNNTNNSGAQSIFGGGGGGGTTSAPAAQSIFGNNSTPIFGDNSKDNSAPSMFGNSEGNAAAPSIFNKTMNNNSSFSNQPVPAKTSIFGNPTPNSAPFAQTDKPGSIFGASTTAPSPAYVQPTLFGKPTSAQPIFGESQPFASSQTSNSVIEQPAPTNISSSNAPSLFGSSGTVATTSIFGSDASAANTTGIFGASKNVEVTKTKSIFGATESIASLPNEPTLLFGKVVKPQFEFPGLYSDINDLVLEDINRFRCDSFDLDFIPLIPPPRELCV